VGASLVLWVIAGITSYVGFACLAGGDCPLAPLANST